MIVRNPSIIYVMEVKKDKKKSAIPYIIKTIISILLKHEEIKIIITEL